MQCLALLVWVTAKRSDPWGERVRKDRCDGMALSAAGGNRASTCLRSNRVVWSRLAMAMMMMAFWRVRVGLGTYPWYPFGAAAGLTRGHSTVISRRGESWKGRGLSAWLSRARTAAMIGLRNGAEVATLEQRIACGLEQTPTQLSSSSSTTAGPLELREQASRRAHDRWDGCFGPSLCSEGGRPWPCGLAIAASAVPTFAP